MRQLKHTEVAIVRAKLLKQQDFKCVICGCSLKGKVRGGACLDHDHDTGVVRGVLCRVCNQGEGKLKTVAVRFGGGKENHRKWLSTMAGYLLTHASPRTEYLYPITKKRKK